MKLAAERGIGGPEPQQQVIAGPGQVHVHAPARVLVGNSHPQTLYGRTARSRLGRGDPRDCPAGRRFLSRRGGRVRRSGSARDVCTGSVQDRRVARFPKSRRGVLASRLAALRPPDIRRTGCGRLAAFEILSGDYGLALFPDRSGSVRGKLRLAVRCPGRFGRGCLRRAGVRPAPQHGLGRVHAGPRPVRRLSGRERHREGRGAPGRRKPQCLRARDVLVADGGVGGGGHLRSLTDAERGREGALLCGRGCFHVGKRLRVPVSRALEKQFEASLAVPLSRAGGQRCGGRRFQHGAHRVPFGVGSCLRRRGSGPRDRRRRSFEFRTVWRRLGLAGQKFRQVDSPTCRPWSEVIRSQLVCGSGDRPPWERGLTSPRERRRARAALPRFLWPRSRVSCREPREHVLEHRAASSSAFGRVSGCERPVGMRRSGTPGGWLALRGVALRSRLPPAAGKRLLLKK